LAVTAAERERLRVKLQALRTEILTEGDIAIEPARKDATEVGNDEDEQPLAEMTQVIASKRNRSRTEVLARVVSALKRIEEQPEEFGLCADCGESIGRRLEAMPYVELCLECQDALDQNDGKAARGQRRRHAGDFR
jgi:DnaK suppressor protein